MRRWSFESARAGREEQASAGTDAGMGEGVADDAVDLRAGSRGGLEPGEPGVARVGAVRRSNAHEPDREVLPGRDAGLGVGVEEDGEPGGDWTCGAVSGNGEAHGR